MNKTIKNVIIVVAIVAVAAALAFVCLGIGYNVGYIDGYDDGIQAAWDDVVDAADTGCAYALTDGTSIVPVRMATAELNWEEEA